MTSQGTELVDMVVVDGIRYRPDEVPKGKRNRAEPDAVSTKNTPSGQRRPNKTAAKKAAG